MLHTGKEARRGLSVAHHMIVRDDIALRLSVAWGPPVVLEPNFVPAEEGVDCCYFPCQGKECCPELTPIHRGEFPFQHRDVEDFHAIQVSLHPAGYVEFLVVAPDFNASRDVGDPVKFNASSVYRFG